MQTITLKGYGTNIPPYEAIELGTYDSYGVEQLQIVPAHGWENLSIIASFFPPYGAEPIKVAVLSSGIIDVPPGATAKQSGKGIIVFAGYKANTQLISTNVAYNIRDHKDIESGDPVCPTPSVVDQIVNAAKAAQENAQAAAQDASEAKTSANKSQENAEKAQQAAEKAAADAAKAEPYAESALAAAKAAKASENATKVSENAAVTSENNARISADKAKASETAAKESAVAAAGSASQAETQKTAAAKSASDAQGYMQTAISAATDANASAENAAVSKAAAENSASAAARSEQAAGTSEVKAAESEKAAKASEQAAAESAQAALESKTAAATSEANAAASAKKAQDVADSLPEDYTTTVNDIATLKQQVANITPDDSTVGEKPWTSKKIVDSLCMPFEESGNPVQCYPVENYPLGVKASWEPVQEGGGDPSPDNIRPITGRDAVQVTRCGKNLININTTIDFKRPQTYFIDPPNIAPGVYTLSCDADNKTAIVYFKFLGLDGEQLRNTVLTMLPYTVTLDKTCAKMEVAFSTENVSGSTCTISNIQLEMGEDATPYEPYTGSTADIALPETVYGGELDWNTGVLRVDWKKETLQNTGWTISQESNFTRFNKYNALSLAAKVDVGAQQFENIICDKLISGETSMNKSRIQLEIADKKMVRVSIEGITTLDDFLNWINDNPLTIAYKLKAPYTIQLTPQQITALSGVNTILTDADSVVVTGAEDPKHTIMELKNAIISLGGNI